MVLSISIAGLQPGAHGMHLHGFGRCEPPAFLSAGAAFNPTGAGHGLLNPKGPRLGDLPNLTVGSDGTARLQLLIPVLAWTVGSPNSIFQPSGLALVITERADDYRTEPDGGSGLRIACGVVPSTPSPTASPTAKAP